MQLNTLVRGVLLAVSCVSAAAVSPQQVFGSPAASPESAALTDYVVADKFSLLDLHRQLVSTPSVSSRELHVAKWLTGYLRSAGLTVELQKVSDDPLNYNVYAYVGSTRKTPVVLTSHIDTVPPYIPYSVEGTKIKGRGTCDAKGSVAAQIIAFLDMVHDGTLAEGQVSLLYVVGEETSGAGMRKASQDLDVDWEIAIFGEPTENKLGVGHKGIVLFNIEVNGKASHSGYPELGISATEILVPLLYRLQNTDLPSSELLGNSTLNVGVINAGVAANVVPGHASATVSIRIADDVEKVVDIVSKEINSTPHVDRFSYFATEPQFLDYDVPGFDSIVLAYTTDIGNLLLPLKKRFLYGPGTIHVAHSDDEYVDNQELLTAIGDYRTLMLHSLSIV